MQESQQAPAREQLDQTQGELSALLVARGRTDFVLESHSSPRAWIRSVGPSLLAGVTMISFAIAAMLGFAGETLSQAWVGAGLFVVVAAILLLALPYARIRLTREKTRVRDLYMQRELLDRSIAELQDRRARLLFLLGESPRKNESLD